MKRIIASIATVAIMAAAAPAFAGDQNFQPHGTTQTITNTSGTLNVEQTVALSCSANFGLYFESDGKVAWLTSASLSGGFLGLCGSVGFPNLAHEVQIVNPPASGSGDATVLRIRNFTVKTISGSCQGDVDFAWNNATKVATFNNVIIPGVSGGNCKINGTLQATNPNVDIERNP